VPTADAGDAAAPTPSLVAAAAPAGRGGFRHSRPLGSYGSRKPGGNVGRAGMGGRALVGPGVAGVAGAGIAPVAASAADGLARGGGGRDLDAVGVQSRRGRGGRSPAGAIGGRRRGRLHLSRRGCSTMGLRRRRWRGRRGTGGATDGGGRRRRRRRARTERGRGHWDGGHACERGCEFAKGRAWPSRPPRVPGSRGRRARQATTDLAPRGGCSALRAERSLPIVCNDGFRGLYMDGGNYLHWLATARVNSQSGNRGQATVSALLA